MSERRISVASDKPRPITLIEEDVRTIKRNLNTMIIDIQTIKSDINEIKQIIKDKKKEDISKGWFWSN